VDFSIVRINNIKLCTTPHIANVGLSRLLFIMFQELLSATWTPNRSEFRPWPYAKTFASNFKMTYKQLAFILIFIPIGLFSQKFEKVDSYIENFSHGKTLTLDKLTKKLTKPFPQDVEKVRAIFDWIADNIKYDYVNFKNKTVTSIQIEPETVYMERKAVCEGYSNLFKTMLDFCNIESKVISGYARNDIETIFLNESNHAWNSAKLNNRWYLFDVTWARDTLNKKINYFYFQTDPKIFILNHYPLDYHWSLLRTKYSLDDYMRFPVYTNLFHELNFTETISKKGYFKVQNDTVTINIKPRFECLLLTRLYDLDKNEWIPTQMGEFIRGDDFFKLYIPRKGKFVLRLGALTQNDVKIMIYDSIIYYLIDNE